MDNILVISGVGDGPGANISNLIRDYWRSTPTVNAAFTQSEFNDYVNGLILDTYCVGGYVINAVGVAVAATIWTPAVDIHYGEVAHPVAHMIDTFWRGTPDMARQLSALRTQCLAKLNATQWLDVKHLSETVQIQRLRKS